MSKFVIKEILAVKGKQTFYELVIESTLDNVTTQKGQLEEYEKGLESKYKSDFTRILALMNRCANGESLTDKQFRDITPAKQLSTV